MKSVLIITDSYGGERKHNGNTEVSIQQTYPYLLKQHYTNLNITYAAASFRKMTEIPKLLASYSGYDVLIIQAGIVDCFPRALSQRMTSSQSFFPKLMRKIIRWNRAFFLRFFRNKPWTTEKDFEMAVSEIMLQSKASHSLFINIAPVNTKQEKENPGARENILRYNQIMKTVSEKYSNAGIIDVHTSLTDPEKQKTMLHPVDSHLTTAGNSFYFSAIKNNLDLVLS